MKKYYVIIICLLFIASITSCAAKQEQKAEPAQLMLCDLAVAKSMSNIRAHWRSESAFIFSQML